MSEKVAKSRLMESPTVYQFPSLKQKSKSNTDLSERRSILARKTQPKLPFLFS